jgi:hypothetical protein
VDDAEVQAIGLDCDGLDVRSGEQLLRLNFPEMITDPSLDVLTSLKMAG